MENQEIVRGPGWGSNEPAPICLWGRGQQVGMLELVETVGLGLGVVGGGWDADVSG